MTSLDEFRQQNPAYAAVPDDKLADGLYNKFYAGKIDRETFNQKIGYTANKPDDGLTTGSKAVDKTLTVLGGPSAATWESVRHPIETLKTIGGGLADYPKDLANAEVASAKDIIEGVKDTVNDPLYKKGYDVDKTALRTLTGIANPATQLVTNTYGRLANKATEGAQAAQNIKLSDEDMAIPATALVGGGGGGKAAKIGLPAMVEALERAGVSQAEIKAAKTPDQMQDLLRRATSKTTQGIMSEARGAPYTSNREMSEDVGKGIGETYGENQKNIVSAYDKALAAGEAVDVNKVSNIGDVRRIVGQYAGQLNKEGQTLTSALKSEKLKGEREVLDLREEIHNLEQEGLKGEDVPSVARMKAELRGKRIENAKAQLAHKEEINKNLEAQIAEAEATEKQYAKGGLPKEINTASDLMRLKQFLNSVNVSNLSAVELAHYKQQKEMVDAALKEAEQLDPSFSKIRNSGQLDNQAFKPTEDGTPPKIDDFGESRKAADALRVEKSKRYEDSAAAKDLGIQEKIEATRRSTGKSELDKHDIANIVAATADIDKQIKNTGVVDWLRNNMPKEKFDRLMATRLQGIIKDIGINPDVLKENRELIDYILSDGIGYKGKKLADMQTIFDNLQNWEINLKMMPAAARGKDPAFQRAVNAAKSMFSLASSGGKPTAYSISKAAESLEAASRGQAHRLEQFRNQLIKQQPRNIPGEAIGAALGGNAAYQDQK